MRTSLFVSGCRNRCKNCFNAVTWDFLYGKPFDQAVEDDIIASTRPRWISGLSLLGGSPLSRKIKRRCWHFFVGFAPPYRARPCGATPALP